MKCWHTPRVFFVSPGDSLLRLKSHQLSTAKCREDTASNIDSTNAQWIHRRSLLVIALSRQEFTGFFQCKMYESTGENLARNDAVMLNKQFQLCYECHQQSLTNMLPNAAESLQVFLSNNQWQQNNLHPLWTHTMLQAIHYRVFYNPQKNTWPWLAQRLFELFDTNTKSVPLP